MSFNQLSHSFSFPRYFCSFFNSCHLQNTTCTDFSIFLPYLHVFHSPFLPDAVQMMTVCKITDKSQTTFILRSIHVHFLQLLRDDALWGRQTCRRHNLTSNIFPPLFLFFASSFSTPLRLCVQRSAELPWILSGVSVLTAPVLLHFPLWCPDCFCVCSPYSFICGSVFPYFSSVIRAWSLIFLLSLELLAVCGTQLFCSSGSGNFCGDAANRGRTDWHWNIFMLYFIITQNFKSRQHTRREWKTFTATNCWSIINHQNVSQSSGKT